MTQDKIKRINELAKKQKENELSDSEKKEQKQLRREYVESVKDNLRKQLDSIEFTD